MALFTVLIFSAVVLCFLFEHYYGFLSKYFVLWQVAMAGEKPIIAKNRLLIFICRSDCLDEKSVLEIYSFVGQQVNYSIDVQEFHKLLLSYRHAVLYRDQRDGSLRGISLINVGRKPFEGKSYIVMQCGACYFDRKYRGGIYKHYVLAYFRLRALFSHPFTPFLLVAEYFSYKTYAQLAHTFKDVYPSHGKETPDFMKEFIDDFANRTLSEGDEYDQETSVLKKAKFYFLKSHATESWAANMEDPHVRFFCQQNPGWESGHQLIAVASVGLRDICVLLRRMVTKGKKKEVLRKPKLLRRITFESDYANKFAYKLSFSSRQIIH